MTAPTLVFCTSYVSDEASWKNRYQPWIDAQQSNGLHADAICLIDDGSPYVPAGLSVIAAEDIGFVPLPRLSIVRFATNLGRASTNNFPGWWRSFTFSLALAQRYGFKRIVHVESDAYLLSTRIVEHLNAIETGWTALWATLLGWPESAFQLICEDQFEAFSAMRDKGPFAWAGRPAELEFPFTNREQKFVGDRYVEAESQIPADADYAAQVAPEMIKTLPRPGVSSTGAKSGEDVLHGTDTSIPPVPRHLADAQTIAQIDEARGSNRLEAALLHVRAARADFPTDARLQAREGAVLYLLKNLPEARRELEAVIARDPGNYPALKVLAATRMEQGESLAASSAAIDAFRLDPADEDSANMAGAFLSAAGRHAQAVPFFLAALHLDANCKAARSNLQGLPWNRDGALLMQYPGGLQLTLANAGLPIN